jgi:TIR domain
MTVGPIQGTVFISYARADAGDLAARLYADLAARGIPAVDRYVCDRRRRVEEIERAIDGCHSALALVSRASFRSNVCRAEQLRALRKGKLLHLEHLNYRDLSDPSKYETGLERILADVASGQQRPGMRRVAM